MNRILELYERPYNPEEPVICFDEKSKQLLASNSVTNEIGNA
ncbi:MAG: hypothetical protein N2V77_05720 [Canidatus Methanoxibalbensis ujae]|nr:hypothetical protein [Candidatus Methanoxibalbensis ujae]